MLHMPFFMASCQECTSGKKLTKTILLVEPTLHRMNYVYVYMIDFDERKAEKDNGSAVEIYEYITKLSLYFLYLLSNYLLWKLYEFHYVTSETNLLS